MNIFNVLSEGKARLHEPSISAMLGYLLDTTRDHGLGDRFLREFLRLLSEKTSSKRLLEITQSSLILGEADLEVPYEHEGRRFDIDIELAVFLRGQEPKLRIIIENKIRAGSITTSQLTNYYNAIKADSSEDEEIVIVYVTPADHQGKFEEEFRSLSVLDGDSKAWVNWIDGQGCLVDIFVRLLEMEMKAEIDPINEYLRHSIKAFVSHLKSRLTPLQLSVNRVGEDIGEITDRIEINIDKERHAIIIRRNSSQIQVYVNGNKVEAKITLREIIGKFNLKVEMVMVNTRTMGRQVIAELRRLNLV